MFNIRCFKTRDFYGVKINRGREIYREIKFPTRATLETQFREGREWVNPKKISVLQGNRRIFGFLKLSMQFLNGEICDMRKNRLTVIAEAG